MAWWKSERPDNKPAKKRFWGRDYEQVEAVIYERAGKRSDIKEPRPRRYDEYGRHTYR